MGEPSNPLLSVVIPAFNESARIIGTLDELARYLDEQTFTTEVLVIDDGSVDGTADMVREWATNRPDTFVIGIPHAGKGWAVRAGMLAARGSYRFMCDADLAMPVHWIGEFLERMEAGFDIVIGSREASGARRFDEPTYRHVMGRVFNGVVRLMAVRGFQDTQCGFKCFRAEVADHLFRLQRTRGMGFDVEILFIAVKRGYSIEEMPIDWYHQEISKVRPGADTIDMLKDTIVVRLRDLARKYG